MTSLYKYKLYGAILGDLSGQPFEFPIMKGPYNNVNIHNPNSKITDDTIMTLASADFLLDTDGTKYKSIEDAYKTFGLKYDGDYYGKSFKEWLKTPHGTTNNSWGNGCLMRISPFMYVKDSLPLIMDSVLCSHKHQVSIESVLKLYNRYKNGYKDYSYRAAYVASFTQFEVRADKTVDFCLNLTAQTFGTHRCIEKAIHCGGDTDTNASICGEFSNYYMRDITKEDAAYVESKLSSDLYRILLEFNQKF